MRALARARAWARARSFIRAFQLTAILPHGAARPKNLGVELPLEVPERQVEGCCTGVRRHGDKLGPVVHVSAEQARGAYESERAKRIGKEQKGQTYSRSVELKAASISVLNLL